ncbi:MAG TPA: MEDS domain-containing protein [Vicinamibacterales bacterium]|nr:MEDS domain-containing protein [Vicinamibacterales bacterium]
MSVRNRTVRGRVSSEHIVQFFDTDESRAQNVAAFLAQGYAAAEPLVIAARPTNWPAMMENLELFGVPVQNAIAEGMLIVKDAHDLVRRLTRAGAPNAAAFEEFIAGPVTEISKRGPRVRAYGEMVDILAQRSDLPDAIALEALWNELGDRVPIFLLCGYAAAHFVSNGTHRALREICKAHSDVHRHAQDPLAAWLLTAAHNSGSAGTILRH